MFGKLRPFGKRTAEGDLSLNQGASRPKPEFPNARPLGNGVFTAGNGGSDAGAPFHQITDLIVDASKANGVFQPETALSAVGAIAGFGAQQAICEGPIHEGKMTPAEAFLKVDTRDGQSFFAGEFLSIIIASMEHGHLSIWRMVAGTSLTCGATSLPDLKPLFAASAGTVGSPAFGKPQWAGANVLLELPRDALRHWPAVRSILKAANVPALHWPLEIARAAQALIAASQSTVPPEKAALIVMEAAINMSKVDPRFVAGAVAISR